MLFTLSLSKREPLCTAFDKPLSNIASSSERSYFTKVQYLI
jgi:hypothetical protein